MIRLLLVLFLLAATEAAAGEAKIIKADKIGNTYRSDIANIGTERGVQYYELHKVPDMLVDPDLKYVSSSSSPSADDKIQKPVALAVGPTDIVTPDSLPASEKVFIGKVAALESSIRNIVDKVATDASSKYSDLKSLINSLTTGGTVSSANASNMQGQIVRANNDQNYKFLQNVGVTGMDPAYVTAQINSAARKVVFEKGGCWDTTSNGTNWYCTDYSSWNGTWLAKLWNYTAVPTEDSSTLNPSEKIVDYNGLKNALSPAPSAVQSDISQAMKDLPASKVGTDGQKLNASEVSSLLAKNAADVANAVANGLAGQAASSGTNADNSAAQQAAADAAKAAADAAKAAADAAKDDEDDGDDKETYAGIETDGFKEPYKPGGDEQHDLSDRFSSFVDSVKSSPLFSFSSDFFNSLPGGGSPILEINGGDTFGTHTFDFSQTFASGLAVIKSVMLALFGFLSIRAIIMKR